MTSFFHKYVSTTFPYRYAGTLAVTNIHGGVPKDPKTIEGWLRSKVVEKDSITHQQVSEVMEKLGTTEEEAIDIVAAKKVNGFFSDENGLYIPGNSLKACLKEASNVAANSGTISSKGWGNPDNKNYAKGIKSWFPEHVFVVEDRLYLGVDKCDEIDQRFTLSAQYGSSITREEVVRKAVISFTIETDYQFTDKQWGTIWLTAERQGLGASRSQGFGTFEVTSWNLIK
jgi:hypothetical protein